MRVYLLLLTLCSSLLIGSCSLAESAASALIADPPEAKLDVGAAVQLGKTNINKKLSLETTDKRLVTSTVENKTEAEQLNQSWNVPWCALLIAVLAGIMVDPLTMYERYRHIKQ